ncbi:MAG: MarR family winged helix-turn-helix transcriptional regulator [Bacillota bacterium]
MTRRQEAAIKLLVAADLVRKRMAAAVEPYGVTLQQYNVLRILRGAGEPLPTLEIGDRMIEQTPGVTRLIDRLEQKDLVARRRSSEDRRVYYCSITAEGLSLLASMDAVVDAADDASVDPLDPDQTDSLITLLDTLLRGSR